MIKIKKQSSNGKTMQTKRQIMVFGEDWGSHPSSTQYFITELLNDSEVLWVNSIGMRRPKLNRHDIARVFKKLKGFIKKNNPKSKKIKNLYVFQPIIIPLPNSKMIRKINKWLLKKQCQKACDLYQIKDPILWLSLPNAVDIIDCVDHTLSLYYCGDDFSGLSGVDHQPITRMENELIKKVDIIITASHKLSNKFPAEKTHVIEHGVDYKLFTHKENRPKDMPLSNPIAGFYGSLDKWLDKSLLEYCFSHLPNWNFVFIGPMKDDYSFFKKYNNVKYLGVKHHNQLAGYVQNWNASLIPFRHNKQIEACNPLKLREYLAAGQPIVTTDFPALKKYCNYVKVCSSKEMFIKAIQETLNVSAADKIKQSESVSNESWEQRTENLKEIIDRHISHY